MKYYYKRIICFTVIVIWLVIPRHSLAQRMWTEQSKLLEQLRKSKGDTSRVHLFLKLSKYYMFREYYVYKTGNPKAQLDTAISFAEKALFLSQLLKYENGKNEAILLKGDALIRKEETSAALNLMDNSQDSIRFRLLIIYGRHYLFHRGRYKTNMDTAMLFLEQAKKLAPVHLSERSQMELVYIKAMQTLITNGFQESIPLYQQMIAKIGVPGNEEREALLWYELAVMNPSRKGTGITRLYCYQKMLALYNKDGNQERQAFVSKTIADIHLVNGEIDLAEVRYLESLERYKAIGYRNLHYIYELLAATSRSKGDFLKSNFYGLKASENTQATNDPLTALTFYGRLANLYRQSGQPDKSVEWYSKTLNNRLFKDGNNVYKFRDAGLFARELIKIKREKDALIYMLDIKAKNKPLGIDAKACLIGSLAYCYRAVKQERMAEKYYLELIALSKQLQRNNDITYDAYYEIGQYLIDKRQYGKALTYLKEVRIPPNGANPRTLTKDIHLLRFKADSGLGNYTSAIQSLLKHKQLNDSIFNETKNWQIQELQLQFESTKKDKDIKLLNNENQLHLIRAEQADRTRNVTLVGFALLLVIVGLLFNSYLIKQRNNRKLMANQRELDQKNNFLETLNNEQKKLLNEKEWLIKEVHHRVKNNLQMVTSLLYSQSVYLEDNAAKLAVNDSLRRMQAMSLIHQKLYQDENMTTIALPGYVKDLANYLNESFDAGSRITFDLAVDSLELDVAQAIPLGLIITESIVNAIKFAFLNRQQGIVSIHLQLDGPDHLLLKISDNGIGLPEGLNTHKPGSLGFDLMQGLTKQLKGNFHIEDKNGVHITVRFMISNKHVL